MSLPNPRSQNKGSVVEAVLRLLEEHPEGLTPLEMALLEDGSRQVFDVVCKRMNRPNSVGPKRLYVHSWKREAPEKGHKRYPRPVYRLGDKPDKKKPPRETKEAKRRYEQKQIKTARNNFVFNLGRSVESIRKCS